MISDKAENIFYTLDAEEMRRDAIMNIFGVQPVYGADEEYIFYYDETNNIRKLYLTDRGSNAAFKNFVLGGIVHPRDKIFPDTDDLITSLVLQKSAKEIKFNQLAKGDFTGVLNSQKIRTLLAWLINNDISIHYTNFNILYWSIVDIVDSILLDDGVKEYVIYCYEIKNELFRLCNLDLDNLLKILKNYQYPNIQRDNGKLFLRELSNHFKSNITHPMADITDLILQLLKHGENVEELSFLVDNDDDILIENFKDQYLRPIYMYPNSIHIFDEEYVVQEELEFVKVKYQDKFVNYKFVKSTDLIQIQLSDVVCGLLGSYFNYLEDHSIRELLEQKKKLNVRQLETLDLLKNLILKSEKISNGFCHRTAPWESNVKGEAFLFGIDPPKYFM